MKGPSSAELMYATVSPIGLFSMVCGLGYVVYGLDCMLANEALKLRDTRHEQGGDSIKAIQGVVSHFPSDSENAPRCGELPVNRRAIFIEHWFYQRANQNMGNIQRGQVNNFHCGKLPRNGNFQNRCQWFLRFQSVLHLHYFPEFFNSLVRKFREKEKEERILTAIVQMIEPLVDASFRDESIGDILEMHYCMRSRQIQFSKRVLMTIWRFISLVIGSFRMKVSDVFCVRSEKKWINSTVFTREGTTWLLLLFTLISPTFNTVIFGTLPSNDAHALESLGHSYR